MTLQADILVDRRKLKRRLGVWRFAAIIAVLAGAVLAMTGSQPGWLDGLQDHVARIEIDGVITDDSDQQKLLARVAKSNRVKGVILRINSPGGTTAGSEALYLSIRELAGKKPVVAVLGTVAASGGYIAALGADHIVARGNTVTGSVGVIFQWAEVSDLLTRLGVRFEVVKSGALKGQPTPFTRTSEEVRRASEEMVRDAAQWFYGLVRERRKLSEDETRALADGRVFTGRQALKVRLIDAIGGEETGLAWLVKEHKISKALEVIDWSDSTYKPISVPGLLLSALASKLGFSDTGLVGALIKKTSQNKRLSLDGLVSVWHPEAR